MAITKEQRDKLFNFLGYGNLNAPFWFVGMEEAGGKRKKQGNEQEIEEESNWSLEQNIDVRIRLFEQVMDLHVAHDNQHLKWPICEQKKYPSVWVYMAKIVAALKGEDDWRDTQKAKTYICENLGRTNGETFLTEMLPLPKRSANNWPAIYRDLFSEREEYEREQYEREIRPYRADLLKRLTQQHSPRYVFCYGETHYDHFKTIADKDSGAWKTVYGTKIQVSRSENTIFVLTPFLGNGRIGSKALQALFDDLKQ